MKSLTNLREAIIRAHNRGRGQQEIADFLGVSQSVVSKAISRFEETGSYEDRPGRGRKKTARNPRNIRRAKGMTQRNPTSKTNSTRKLAKKLGIGKSWVHEILSVDLGLKPFKYQKRQKLTAEAKKKRLDRARALLRRFARGKHKMIIFSDEKLFDTEQVGCFVALKPFQSFNPQNDRIWAKEAPETEDRLIGRTQKPASLMVWAAISARGKTSLVFVEQGVKIDRHVYMDMLRRHLFAWANGLFEGEDWCFQQDGAPGHKANETQEFLRENCSEFISVDRHWRDNNGEWPPNSPDLNPLDYAIWSILEEKACSKPHLNVESLKRALKKAWNEINVETLAKIVDNFPKRLKKCVEAKGGHFE